MFNGQAMVVGYSATHTRLTKQLKEDSPATYDQFLLMALYAELSEKGMKAERIGKPTKKGTLVRFKRLETQKELNAYEEKLLTMSDEIKEKYGLIVLERKTAETNE